MSNYNLYNFQNTIFNIFIISNYLVYGLLAFGIISNYPQYLSLFDNFIKIYISLFLLLRFNPLRRIKFTELDRKIAFSAGVFIFTTSTLNQILMYLDIQNVNILTQNS